MRGAAWVATACVCVFAVLVVQSSTVNSTAAECVVAQLTSSPPPSIPLSGCPLSSRQGRERRGLPPASGPLPPVNRTRLAGLGAPCIPVARHPSKQVPALPTHPVPGPCGQPLNDPSCIQHTAAGCWVAADGGPAPVRLRPQPACTAPPAGCAVPLDGPASRRGRPALQVLV